MGVVCVIQVPHLDQEEVDGTGNLELSFRPQGIATARRDDRDNNEGCECDAVEAFETKHVFPLFKDIVREGSMFRRLSLTPLPGERRYPSPDILDLGLQLWVGVLPEIHKPIIVFNCVFPVPAFFI